MDNKLLFPSFCKDLEKYVYCSTKTAEKMEHEKGLTRARFTHEISKKAKEKEMATRTGCFQGRDNKEKEAHHVSSERSTHHASQERSITMIAMIRVVRHGGRER